MKDTTKRRIFFILLIILTLTIIVIVGRSLYKAQCISNINNKILSNIDKANNTTLYNNIIGDNANDCVKELTRRLSTKKNRTANESLMLGHIWNHVMHDVDIADQYYTEVVDVTRDNPDALTDFEFFQLLDVLNDDNVRTELGDVYIDNIVTKDNEDLHRVTIRSDSQNVHDSVVNDSLVRDYGTIKAKIAQCKASIPSFSSTCSDIKNNASTFNVSHDAINKVINRIKSSGKYDAFNEDEKNIISTMWSYVNLINDDRDNLAKENFIKGVAECYEENSYGNGVVCQHGRITKMLGSLIMNNPDGIGNYITDQFIRKKCFDTAAKMRETHKKQDILDEIDNIVPNNYDPIKLQILKNEISIGLDDE
jgi:hypothetical protein